MTKEKNRTELAREGTAAVARTPGRRREEEEQRVALNLLRTGKSVAECANRAGVTRQSVYRWLKTDPEFAAAYNQWQEEVMECARARHLTLIDKATDSVERSIEKGDGGLGLRFLEKVGAFEKRTKPRTDPDEIRRRAELEEQERRYKLERDERRVKLDEQKARRDDEEYEKGIVKLVKSTVVGGPVREWERLPKGATAPEPLPKTADLIAALKKNDPEKWGKGD